MMASQSRQGKGSVHSPPFHLLSDAMEGSGWRCRSGKVRARFLVALRVSGFRQSFAVAFGHGGDPIFPQPYRPAFPQFRCFVPGVPLCLF